VIQKDSEVLPRRVVVVDVAFASFIDNVTDIEPVCIRCRIRSEERGHNGDDEYCAKNREEDISLSHSHRLREMLSRTSASYYVLLLFGARRGARGGAMAPRACGAPVLAIRRDYMGAEEEC